MKGSSSCRGVPTARSRARSWVENTLVTNEMRLLPTATRMPLGTFDGTRRYLVIGTTLNARSFLDWVVLARSLSHMKDYRQIPEWVLLQRAIAITVLLTRTPCKRFYMRLIVALLCPKLRRPGSMISPSTFPTPMSESTGVLWEQVFQRMRLWRPWRILR